jgi:hypothetical protein
VRVRSVSLTWFRGAADLVTMEPGCKSIVIYGPNASGKSSFVDAIEFLLNGGRITHLAHEYSGKHQHKAVPNTHKPRRAETRFLVTFCDGSEIQVLVNQDGSTKVSGATDSKVVDWEYRRAVLRQDEVARFIQDTKGDKYSSLLPLLGLHQMDVAAENLKQLRRNIESLSDVQQTKLSIAATVTKRNATFGPITDDELLIKIKELSEKYRANVSSEKDAVVLCESLMKALEIRIAMLTSDQRRYLGLRSIADVNLITPVESVRQANANLANAADPLISQKLSVLEPTEALIAKFGGTGMAKCPACGQSVEINKLREHVASELAQLREIRQRANDRKSLISTFCDVLRSLKQYLRNPDIQSWRDEILSNETLCASITYLDDLNTEGLRSECTEEYIAQIQTMLLPLIEAADLASKDAPIEAKQLQHHQMQVETAKAIFEARNQSSSVERIDALTSVVQTIEQVIREQIRTKSKSVIDGISDEVCDMWATLHPHEAIENIHLYIPKDTDKAIDIGLKFHGKELDSPRLTLSEGYRNSLGLCIFLAMADQVTHKDRPIFLDDVVVSLDRHHRGMVVELLEKYFSERQIILLTHDRDWYTELRQQLGNPSWVFKALLPYENPEIGIRWSHTESTFGDARAQLLERPDSAGNDARKIMDVELAIIAERLKIRLPYLRFEKNDRRTAHEFLKRLIADGRVCFQKQNGSEYVIDQAGIDSFNLADKLLSSWGNRASHNFDLVRPEAAKLIEACEAALEAFTCKACKKKVYFADAQGNEYLQCHCGEIRWRYGKS